MFAATRDDVELIGEFLAAPESERRDIAIHLRRLLDQRTSNSAPQHIPCRRPLGLYVLLPAPMADWLSRTLVHSDDEVDQLRDRLAAGNRKQLVAQPSLQG